MPAPFCTDFQIAQNHELLRRAQRRHALGDLGFAIVGTNRCGPAQHRRAVALLGPDVGDRGNRRRKPGESANLLAFDHYVLIVRADASALEPGIAENAMEHRNELAEVRRTFDRSRAETKILGQLVVVKRKMTVIGLLGKHLPWLAEFAANIKGLIEWFAHWRSAISLMKINSVSAP